MKSVAKHKLLTDPAFQRMIVGHHGVDWLLNAATGDPLRCRVGPDGPNCHSVWQAYRLTRDLEVVTRELDIVIDAVLQALAYYSRHPVQRSEEELEWEALGLAHLFSSDDAIPTEHSPQD